MKDTLLIATSKAPGNLEELKNVNKTLREWSTEANLKLVSGITWTEGPGCANLAMRLEGTEEDWKSWADQVTMALMPSKWSNTRDIPSEVDTCTLSWNVQ